MQVIIPVAGEGIRLKPHTHFIPKCLLNVAGKPILGHILDRFSHLDISKIIIILGTKTDSIIQFCKKYPFNFKFVIQHKRLGLGHAIYLGAYGLKGQTIVLLGDTIIEYDFRKFSREDVNIIAVKEVDDPRRFGVVELDGEFAKNFAEKPDRLISNLAIVGLYYFVDIRKLYNAMATVIKRGIKTKNEYQLTDGLALLLKQGEKFKTAKVNHWFDCGTPDSLIKSNQYLLKKNHYYLRRKNCLIIPPVYIPDSAELKNSVIGPNASIGECVRITNSIVQDSIINSNAVIENAILSKSIIGQNAIVRSNYRKLNVGDFSIIEFP